MIINRGFFIPGGFFSLLVAVFVRLWALDHGHIFLARLALVYIVILLIPLAIFLLVMIFAGLAMLYAIISFRRRNRF